MPGHQDKDDSRLFIATFLHQVFVLDSLFVNLLESVLMQWNLLFIIIIYYKSDNIVS